MKKVNQKIKSYAANVNVLNHDSMHRRVVHYIFVAFLGLALCYVFILMNMVFSIVERKSLQAHARELTNEIGDLELKYLALSGEVDANLSKQMGFHEVKPSFTSTSKPVGTLAKVSNEI